MPMNVTMGGSGTVENTVSNAMNAALTPDAPGLEFMYLSPDSLLAFVQMQLQKTDSNIGVLMGEVDQRREAGQLLGEAVASMKEAKLALGNNPAYFSKEIKVTYGAVPVSEKVFPNTPQGELDAEAFKAAHEPAVLEKGASPEVQQEMANKLSAAAEKAEAAGFHDLSAKLQKLADDVDAGKSVSGAQLDSVIEGANQTLQAMSSSSEMTMMRLQELVQERSRKIMFASNTLASINESARKIIENTR